MGRESLKFDQFSDISKVFIGERHVCSCKAFSKENDLCKHICWVLLKKFRLNVNDPSKYFYQDRHL